MNCSRTGRGSSAPPAGSAGSDARRVFNRRCLLVVVAMVLRSLRSEGGGRGRPRGRGSRVRVVLFRRSVGGTNRARSFGRGAVRRRAEGFVDQSGHLDAV